MTEVSQPGEEGFASLLEESFKAKEIKEGEVVDGTIVRVTPDFVLVDIGYKSEGRISISQFGRTGSELKEGDEIKVFLERIENDNGEMILSKERADALRVWDQINDAVEKDELVEGTIIGRVKGGLSVDIGVKAFLPGSQVDLRPLKDVDRLIGKKYKFKILKFNRKRGNIVISRKVLLEGEREKLRSTTISQLQEGMVIDGIVKNITDYGAFIDLGGIDGLLHITDMSWGRISHPSELFSVGDDVKVKILKYDESTQRVSLGLKQIQEDPWEKVASAYPIGAKVRGSVVSLADYGAFIELESGIEGLIHVSEMSWTKRIKHPSKVLNIGDEVEAIVLDVDQENKRISLGLKQIEANPWDLLEEKYPSETKIKGIIRNITDFGLFVGVEDGIDGLVHISDLSWTSRIKHPNEVYNKGDEIDAVVLSIDKENKRFSLGIKQLTDDPWKEIPIKFPPGEQVTGKVTTITNFGIFIELEPNIEGLIHLSELPDEIKQPEQTYKPGDEITAEIISVDAKERKIGLSVKSIERKELEGYLEDQKEGGPKLGDIVADELKKKEEDDK